MENYTKSRVIGKGSYGEVWLAKHKRDKKQYVLKKIDLQRSSSKERRAAEQEAKLLHKLRHPNIVAYKDSFEADDGYLYIAMGYCEGGDLYNKLKEQKGAPLEERQVVEWFVQIAMALQYMHERNILHRDLKTQNIFLTKSKIIKVGDLGIARVLDSSNDMATTLIGTPYYMSPELFSNKPYNHKSDVWALGCCVYEMATLKHAFNAKDMNSLVYKILRGRMPAMPKIYSPELTALIRSQLSQNPDKRPSVNRILRDPYIKKNIAIFLEGTKKRRPSTGSSRPPSASSSRHSSVSDAPEVPESSRSNVSNAAGGAKVYDNRRQALRQNQEKVEPLDIGQELSAIKEEASPAAKINNKPQQRRHQGSGDGRVSNASRSPTPEKSRPLAGGSPARNPVRKKKNRFLKPKAPPPIEVEVHDSSLDNHDNHIDHPKPEENHVNNDERSYDVVDSEAPRQLPVSKSRAPKASDSVPQKSKSKHLKPSSGSSSASSMASSKENREEKGPKEEVPAETPRSSINSSARARRREKKESETPRDSRVVVIDKSRRHSESHDGPVLNARKQASKKALGLDEADGPLQRPRSAGNARDYANPSARGRRDFDRDRRTRVQKQPSVGGESSSTDSEDEIDNQVIQNDREKRRKNKEMEHFISALDTTLKMNKPKAKSESDDSEDSDDDDIVTATPRPLPPKPQLNAVPEDRQLIVDPSARHRRNISEPPKPQPAATLGASTRLMDRIAILRKDCIRGLGVEKLKRAYDILDNIDGDELEPQLIELLGYKDFELFAGKIWQLKFCEENAFGYMNN